MSSIADQRAVSTSATDALSDRAEQAPWSDAREHAGRHAVARGNGRRRTLAVSVMLDLDAEQSEWLRHEVARTGRDYESSLKELLDRERANRP